LLDGVRGREWLRDLAFIAVIAIVLAYVGLALWSKSEACSARGGHLQVFIRTSVQCILPDGDMVPM
jgi:hypothetical protein